uniref:Uncharacterized protein n=1 Tax=Arundo donax TaxID=35708 RepID=A0A0A8ZY22_ARUDO
MRPPARAEIAAAGRNSGN